MNLLLVRHAIAEDAEEFCIRTHGVSDHLRPLTARGIKKFELGLVGLKTLVPRVDLIVSSPWKRAQETAYLIAKKYRSPNLRVKEWAELTPGTSFLQLLNRANQEIKKQIQEQAPVETLVWVGHETHLSRLFCALLTGSDKNVFFQFKKGGMALLSISEDEISLGGAHLRWALEPRALRRFKKVSKKG